jgi:Flp pilus assembly protein TadG
MPQGKILVVTALMLVPLIGFAALAVDIGVLAAARAQLKTVADAAALAGARQLVSDNRLQAGYVPTVEAAAASSKAIAIGQANTVMNQNAVVLSSDVLVGVMPTNPPNPNYTITSNNISPTTNSVQVTAYRDDSHAGVVPAFFSRIWGLSGSTASVISTATVEVYSISGYNPGSGTGSFLPFALDQVAQNNLLTNGSTNLYPIGTQPGNYGTIDFGVSSNSTKVLNDQILNGITPAEMTAASSTFNFSTLTGTFEGNTGVSAGIKASLNAVIGQPRLVLVYSTVVGPGANAVYTIVGVQAIKITGVNFQGSNKTVTIQPAYSYDPGDIPGAPSSWTQGGMIRLHLSR